MQSKAATENAVVKLSQNMIDRARYIESISTHEYIKLQKNEMVWKKFHPF